MPFLQLTIEVGARDPSRFEDALFAAGASSVTLADAADDPILEPAPGATPLWPTVTVTALFSHDANRDAILQTLRAAIQGEVPAHAFIELADRAWEREWLKDFKPMQFGQRLWICPGGMVPPADCLPVAGSPSPAALIELDPGLAFGTGTHPTTALCLEWLDGADLTGKTIIDYGCGSGILAIAALKLGAAHAVGIDIDHQALLASRDNADRNEVGARLHLQPVGVELQPAPILLANILAGPLVELAPKFAHWVLPGGDLVLSGILQEQAQKLAQTYSAWFDMSPPVVRGDWARLDGKRIRSQI